MTIKQVIMNANVCSKCSLVSSSKPAVHSPRFANYKNHIKLNFEAMVAAELNK